ncbi:MAG: SUF system Fe-S cluster assembly protein [Candidatus Sumerlaeaceae bacterium]|nr:SUF system Fe-S cluster assembly protein [Candidatus Sumerlaeaceae bacterium]
MLNAGSGPVEPEDLVPSPDATQTHAGQENSSVSSTHMEGDSGAANGPAARVEAPAAASPLSAASPEPAQASQSVDPYDLREKIIQVLHTVYDPEIPVDIWELGLVYKLDVREDGNVYIQMTLTSPMCPVAGSLPPEVQQKVASVAGVQNVQVELTWDPPWHMGMMSEVARLKLGFM